MTERSNDSIALRRGRKADAGTIAQMINLAFEVEQFFVEGSRITIEEVHRLMGKGTFWLIEHQAVPAGCVYVEPQGDRAYLGLLSVVPSSQGTGLGRSLMIAAEDYARDMGCKFMDLRVVNVRPELAPFYNKLGYQKNGTAPFPADVVTKMPCHFELMVKPLG